MNEKCFFLLKDLTCLGKVCIFAAEFGDFSFQLYEKL